MAKSQTPEVPSLWMPQPATDVAQSGSAKGDRYERFFFSDGVDRSRPPNLIPPSAARKLENCWYPREVVSPRTRPGLANFGTLTGIDTRITSVHAYQTASGTEYIVFSCLDSNTTPTDQDLYYLDPSTLQPTVLKQYNTGTGALEDATVGSATAIPKWTTFNGHCIMGAEGKPLRSWYGNVAGVNPAARATGVITCTAESAAGEKITIADTQFTFAATRTTRYEITISSNTATQAANIVTAVNMDVWNVSAVQGTGGDTNKVNLTATITGVVGNAYTLVANGTDVTVSGATMSGGVDGAVLDRIQTYEAPTSTAIVSHDRFGRIVTGGASSTRVYFSAPGNEYSFATGSYGLGEYWDLGIKEGNALTAIEPFGAEIMAHKYGPNREMHRMREDDPLPASWELTVKPFTDTIAALNPRCAVSAGDKHLVLDRDRIVVYSGVDTFDEIRAAQDGLKVADLLTGTHKTTSFVVKDPENGVILIFPAAGTACLVYHYSTRRWTTWNTGTATLYCGCYSESRECLLFGTSGGDIVSTSSAVATDWTGTANVAFYTTLLGRTLESEDMSALLLKQTQIDFTHGISGDGNFALLKDRSETRVKPLFSWDIENTEYTLDYLEDFGTGTAVPIGAEGATGDGSATALYGEFYFDVTAYGKENDFTQDRGESVAPYLKFKGAAEINQVVLRLSTWGRSTANGE